MSTVELIRHAMTQGNLENRWVGITDQPLCPEGIALARRCARPAERIPRRVWVSPLLRCRETATILYPGAEQVPVPALRETDFGPFENKNHQELSGDPVYEAWIHSVGEAPVPGMESRAEAAARAVPAVRAILDELAASGENGAIVTHGGVVMAACAALVEPKRNYYDWWVRCCGGVLLDLTDWLRTGSCAIITTIEPAREGIE